MSALIRFSDASRTWRDVSDVPLAELGSSVSDQSKSNSADGADYDDQQWRCAPDGEEDKADKCNAKVARRVHGIRPDRIVERRAKQTDNCGIHAAHHRLGARAFPEIVPERQRAEQDQDTGKENADQS
jgi:hypothetical protein